MTTELTRKNRTTKTHVSARLDDFLGWITICEDHGGYAEHATKSAAISWIAEPWVYCPTCAANLEHN